MVHKNYSTVGLTLLLTTVTVAEVQWVQAQTAAFKLPASVAQGTTVRIDGSSSMAAVNTVLKQRFEQQFPGTQVNIAANGAPAGVQAVLAGQADIAAIGRPLNEQEKAQGLKTVQVGRDKIALLIGANNPFNKSLTIEQFARIFRGEIKNWSQVGGPNAPIKFIDRPDSSDTRQAFKSYPVFRQGKFETGATAERLNEDNTQLAASKLGNNGISYATANQLKGLSGAKAVTMHGTQPTDPRYPFSQALYYVYKDGANPAVQAFLGLATASIGQSAIDKANVADPVTVATAAKATPAQKTATAAKPTAKAGTGNKTAAEKAPSGQAAPGTTATNPQSNNAQGGSSQAGGGNPLAFLFPGGDTAGAGTAADTGLPNWLWWLLPIGSGAALLWMLGRGRRSRPDTGATGTFNAPGYADDRENSAYGGTPYVEGGYDPIQEPGDFSADTANPDLDWNRDQPNNLELSPNFADEVGQPNSSSNLGGLSGAALAGGAAGVGAWNALGGGAKQSRVVLKSRSAQEVEAFWDIPAEERQAMRQQGGEKLALRLYDVTDIDLAHQPAHSVQQFECDELTQRQRLPIALPDRDYLAEIGYLTSDNHWLSLARSAHVRVPAASSGFLGNAAKTGGAAGTGGAAMAGGTVDSAKSYLSGDRDSIVEPEPIEQSPTDSSSWSQPVSETANPTNTTIDPPQTDSQSLFQRVTHRVSDTANNVTQAGNSAMRSGSDAIAGGTAAAAGAGAAAWSFLSGQRSSEAPRIEAPRTEAPSIETPRIKTRIETPETLPSAGIGNVNPIVTGETNAIPTNIGEGRLALTPRNSRWAYASWDIPRSLRSRIDRGAGENLVLRLYDVTDGAIKLPSRYEQHDLDDMALSCDVPIPLSDRTYIAEVGYVDADNNWTALARSTPAHIPAN